MHRLGAGIEPFRRLHRCQSGASAAEFAIVVPMLGVLLTGALDFAQFGNQGLILDAALRTGANYALACAPEAYDCATGIKNVISAYSTSLGSSVAVTFPSSSAANAWYPQHCTWDDATTTVSCDNSVAACDTTQSQCPKHIYVKVQAVWTLPTPLLPLSIMPTTLTRSLTVRVL